jgi:O-antigen ligase
VIGGVRLRQGTSDAREPILVLAGLTGAASALCAGWLVGDGNVAAPLGLALLAPVVFVAARLQAVHWLVVWLLVSGFLGWVPGVRAPGNLPEVTPERVVLLLIVVSVALKPGRWRIGGVGACLALFSVDYFLTAAFESADLRAVTLTFLHHYASAFVVFGLAACGLRTDSARRLLTRAGAVVGGLLAAVALVQPHAGWDLGAEPGEWSNRIAGTLITPPNLGAALAILLVLGLYESTTGRPHWRVVATGSVGMMAAAIMLTFTRAAWASVLVGVGVVGLLTIRRRPMLFLVLLAGIVLSIAAVPPLIDALTDDPRLHDDRNAIGRYETSLLSVQQFSQRPLFGWGPETIRYFSGPGGYHGWVSHNSFLSLLVATGLVGGTLYLLPVGLAIARGGRSVWASDHASGLHSFALAGAATYVVNALAIDMKYFALPHTLFWLCLGVLLGPAVTDRTTGEAP